MVYESVRDWIDLELKDLGEKSVKKYRTPSSSVVMDVCNFRGGK